MNDEILVSLNEINVDPGASLSGQVSWRLVKDPKKIEIRLFWRTAGRGSEDAELVDEITLEHPGGQGMRDFHFELPVEPYSYHGKLISVLWGVEAVAGNKSGLADFVMAPDGVPRGSAAYD